jgi:hypothetical protein
MTVFSSRAKLGVKITIPKAFGLLCPTAYDVEVAGEGYLCNLDAVFVV